MNVSAGNPQFALYLPRVLLEWQSRGEPGRFLEVEGTLLMADISGFTKLSEELSHKGKVGSEEVTRVLNGAFSELLDVAALDGGDLLKFGGDALLHLFTGEDHAARAARSAFDMRDALEEFQDKKSPVPLKMSMGMASGVFELYLAGGSSSEMLIAGPTATEAVDMEATAEAGEILLAHSTVDLIDDGDDIVGDEKGNGVLLEDVPDADEWDPVEAEDAGQIVFSDYVPVPLRRYLTVRFNEGEHRTANVAFVKLAGLDALIASGGAESVGPALDDFVARVHGIAERFGVCVLASDIAEDGAKLILTTGVPERSDAEEERIMRAVHEIAQVESPFKITVGAARGSVFAGDLGSRSRRVYTVMGDTVNLAARLASAAQPGKVLVTHKMMDRAASLFDADELDPIELKGKSKPIRPLQLGAVTSEGAAKISMELPLVGRTDEVETLLAEVETAKGGEGRSIDLVGVAGIGKTRIIREVAERASIATLLVGAEPYEESTAYYVAGKLVRAILDLKYDVDPDVIGDHLTAIINERASHHAPWLPLIARVVAAHVPSTPEVDAIDDKFQTQKAAEVIAELIGDLLQDPTLMVFYSAEWMDDASRQILMPLLKGVADHPWAICVSRRPGPGWEKFEAMVEMEIAKLSPEETRELAEVAAGDMVIAPATFEAIIDRSGGNPFFLIELVAAAKDGGDTLPESIEAAAAARIDRLQPSDRRLLRYAAVLGQTFTIDLLADALPDVADMLEDETIWSRLAEFLRTTSTGTVRFQQPILRDVAYDGLPFGTRKELHASVGEALERRARRRPERFAELLSLHFDRAEDYTKSWEYSVMGAERARRKYANLDAAELYERALGAAEKMEDKADPLELADVAEALGDVSDMAGMHENARVAYEKAVVLSGDTPTIDGRLLRKQGMVKEKTGEYGEALGLIQKALDRLAEGGPSPERTTEELEAQVGYAGVLNRQGDREGSAEWCRKVIDSSDGEVDPAALAHAYNLLETNYTDLNHPDRGKFYDKALAIYKDTKDLVGEAKVLNNLGYNEYFLGNWVKAGEYWEQSEEASEKAGDVVTAAMVMHNIGEIDVDRGLLTDARKKLRAALRIWRGAGYTGGVAYAQMNLGRLESRAGNRELAQRYLNDAIDVFTSLGDRLTVLEARSRLIADYLRNDETDVAMPMLDEDLREAEKSEGAVVLRGSLRRLKGYALLRAGDADAAKVELDQSLELTREAKAKFEEGLTLLALSSWAEASGSEDEWVAAAESIFSELGVEHAAHLDITEAPDDEAHGEDTKAVLPETSAVEEPAAPEPKREPLGEAAAELPPAPVPEPEVEPLTKSDEAPSVKHRPKPKKKSDKKSTKGKKKTEPKEKKKKKKGKAKEKAKSKK